MSYTNNTEVYQDTVNSKENQIPDPSREKIKKGSDLNTSYRGLKFTANKKLSTFVNAIDNLSERLRRSMRRPRVLKDSNYSSLGEATSAQTTPVKLYSPFGIETPSPSGGTMPPPIARGFLRRRFEFSSPSGKLQKDVKEFSDGVNELNRIVSTLEGKVEKRVEQ